MSITISIRKDEDGIYWIRSSEMRCDFPIGKNPQALKWHVKTLIEEWIDISEF
jgi:predicted RNase H-like HicB family nuclease